MVKHLNSPCYKPIISVHYFAQHMNIEAFFQKLGLDEKETRVLVGVIRLGFQPASVIAKNIKLDRTTTYRILKQLCDKKILAHSKKNGITVFYLKKISDIEGYLNEQKKKMNELSIEYKKLTPEIAAFQGSVQEVPKIQIYEGHSQLETFYNDIVNRAVEQHLLLIRILGSNTFSQKLERKELGEIIENFKKNMAEKKIEADIFIAQGNLTREWISELHNLADMEKLPAAGGATNVILVGDSVFVISFRDFPVGLRIDHPDIAQTMHFLLDMCGK
ncbi:MAG: helix-turn-helix domain-containing protein [Candidatus Gracilibacteria bacterium]